jgi:hypothetical protein
MRQSGMNSEKISENMTHPFAEVGFYSIPALTLTLTGRRKI